MFAREIIAATSGPAKTNKTSSSLICTTVNSLSIENLMSFPCGVSVRDFALSTSCCQGAARAGVSTSGWCVATLAAVSPKSSPALAIVGLAAETVLLHLA